MKDELRDTILEAMEQGLDAQLRAVRRLRKGEGPEPKPRPRKSRSQIDMAYDILAKAAQPLHVNELLERIHGAFGITVDRESLVSSLTKKVARGDRFVRTGKNTFGLKGGKR
jgi:hypothetical protein